MLAWSIVMPRPLATTFATAAAQRLTQDHRCSDAIRASGKNNVCMYVFAYI